MSSSALFSESCVRFPPPLSESAMDVIELFQVVKAEHTPSAQSAVDCRLGDSSRDVLGTSFLLLPESGVMPRGPHPCGLESVCQKVSVASGGRLPPRRQPTRARDAGPTQGYPPPANERDSSRSLSARTSRVP